MIGFQNVFFLSLRQVLKVENKETLHEKVATQSSSSNLYPLLHFPRMNLSLSFTLFIDYWEDKLEAHNASDWIIGKDNSVWRLIPSLAKLLGNVQTSTQMINFMLPHLVAQKIRPKMMGCSPAVPYGVPSSFTPPLPSLYFSTGYSRMNISCGREGLQTFEVHPYTYRSLLWQNTWTSTSRFCKTWKKLLRSRVRVGYVLVGCCLTVSVLLTQLHSPVLWHIDLTSEWVDPRRLALIVPSTLGFPVLYSTYTFPSVELYVKNYFDLINRDS